MGGASAEELLLRQFVSLSLFVCFLLGDLGSDIWELIIGLRQIRSADRRGCVDEVSRQLGRVGEITIAPASDAEAWN